MKKPNLKQQYRVNEQIRGVREVRIVGDDIASSVVSISTALQIAEQKGVDLVEISPNAEPPNRLVELNTTVSSSGQLRKIPSTHSACAKMLALFSELQ